MTQTQWKQEVTIVLTVEELAVINAVFGEETTRSTTDKVKKAFKELELETDVSYSLYVDTQRLLRRHLNEEEEAY